MSTKMKPTEKRTEGAIYSFELREQKERELKALKDAKCICKNKRIRVLSYDNKGNLIERFIYAKS
jgi:hypothetical protein